MKLSTLIQNNFSQALDLNANASAVNLSKDSYM